jgi:predicted kinase
LNKKIGAIVLSSDEIREQLFGNETNQDNNGKVFEELHNAVKYYLKLDKDVVYDATNISYKRRIEFLKSLNNIPDVEKIAIMVVTPIEKCIEQNNLRDRKVPIHVIDRMYKQFYVPQYFEGWDKIEFIWNDCEEYNKERLLKEIDIEQNNPHHTLTVKEHCSQCCENMCEVTESNNLLISAMLHDIGKPYCKTFENKKREITEIAHYYGHENVGAYNSLCYTKNDTMLTEEDSLEISKYIQWHMLFYNDMSEKTIKKYEDLLGFEFTNNLKLLKSADEKAK